MASTIKIKNSSTASAVPTSSDLVQGELAINVTDKRMFTENSGGTVVELGTNPSSLTLSGGTANGVAYLNGSKALTTGSALVFDGTNLGVGVTPSAWGSNFRAVEVAGGALWTDNSVAGANINLFKNAYADTNSYTYKYKASYAAFGYTQDAGGHKWLTAPSGTAGNAITFTQAMTLDASGNLGVGTTSPGQRLHIRSDSPILKIQDTGGGSGETQSILFATADGSSGYAEIAATSSGTAVGSLIFKTASTSDNPAERARIDSSGNLLVGTTDTNPAGNNAAGFAFQNGGLMSVSRDGNPCAFLNRSSSNGEVLRWYRQGSQVGNVSVTTTATAYNTSSDYRLKENVQPMTGALSVVQQLNPCTYTWKADGSDGQGFIAHELAEVVPDAVTGEKDAVDAEGNPQYQGIDTSFLVATLTAAIQELKAEFDAYKATHP